MARIGKRDLWQWYRREHEGKRALVGKPKKKKHKAKRAKAAAAPQTNAIKRFYKSVEWKRIRYDVLVDSKGRCECCGKGTAEGVTLNVDHIKPVKRFWELRLERSNLQVLCALCNAGKGSRDETDWRKAETGGVLWAEGMTWDDVDVTSLH